MTARIVVSCDGAWDDGRMPCRAAFPSRWRAEHRARGEALAAGWTTDMTATVDLCPACSRQAQPC